MKNVLVTFLLLLSVGAYSSELRCSGKHFTQSTPFGGKLEGNCKGALQDLEVELEYQIDTIGVGFGASTTSYRNINLELNSQMINTLKRKNILDLESCNGGSISIGYIGGVNYSKVCAREDENDIAKACITFKGGLLYSGLGVELGASCDKFRLTLIN